jgi:hypothetical protein
MQTLKVLAHIFKEFFVVKGFACMQIFGKIFLLMHYAAPPERE